MIGSTRYLHWRRRRRAGWLALLMTTAVCMVLTSVPAVATPILPVPTDPADAVSSDSTSSTSVPLESCLWSEDPLDQMYPAGIPGLSDGLSSECQAAGQGAQADSEGGGSGEPAERERMRALQEQYGMSGCRVVEGFNDRCPAAVGDLARPSSSGLMITEFKSVSSPDGQWLYGVGVEVSRDVPTAWSAIITKYGAPTSQYDGAVVWQTRIGLAAPENGRVDLHNVALNVAVSYDGSRLYVTGTTYYLFAGGFLLYEDRTSAEVDVYSKGPAEDGWVAAVDTADGGIVWNRSLRPLLGARAASASGFRPFGLAISPDDQRVFVSSGVLYDKAWVRGPQGAAWHFAFDAESGLPVWVQEVAPASALDYSSRTAVSTLAQNQLTVSPDGSRLYSQVFVMDTIAPWVADGFMTLALDTVTGTVAWKDTDMPELRSPVDALMPQSGVLVSPDGSHVYSLRTAYTPATDADPRPRPIGYLVRAYDAATGSTIWSHEYILAPDGCTKTYMYPGTFGRAVALSPSGDHLYLLAPAYYHHKECTWTPTSSGEDEPPYWEGWGTAVFSVRAATGDLDWATYHSDSHLYVGGGLVVVPGPAGGDAGSRVIIVTNTYPLWSSMPWQYATIVDLDAADGRRLWQARFLNTFNDEKTDFRSWGSGMISPDGTHLYVLVEETHRTPLPENAIEKNGMKVLAYDIQNPIS